MRKIIFIILITLLLSTITGLEISSYVNETKIGIQDNLKLTVEISGEDAGKINFELPKIQDFSVLGSSSSSSTSMTMVNGNISRKVTKSLIYNLRPQKKGTFLIKPFTIKFKGKNLSTKPIRVRVVDGSTQQLPPSNNLRKRSSNSQLSRKVSDNIFIKADLSKNSVYRGEPFILSYKLYTRYDIRGLGLDELPEFNNFWKEDLFIAEDVNFSTEILNGKRFYSMLIQKHSLTPNKTGVLTIPQLSLKANIQVPSQSFFDFPQTKQIRVQSKPLSINVHEIPIASQPADFSGAIGNFSLSSKVSNRNMKVGDSFTYTLQIKGEGNLKQFSAPELRDIPHFRYMNPEITNKMNKNSNKPSGVKTVKYLVIAQEEGNFELPPIKFTFFNPTKEKYITRTTDSYKLKVSPGESNIIYSQNSNQRRVIREGDDISFIKTPKKITNFKLFFHSKIYWAFWLILILTIPLSFIYSKELEKLTSDSAYFKKKKADKILKKYMKTAAEKAKENDREFYTAAQNGLSNFIADKLNIARGSQTEQIVSKLKEKDETTAENFSEYFELCNRQRFMPESETDDKISEDYEKLRKIVSKLSKIKF